MRDRQLALLARKEFDSAVRSRRLWVLSVCIGVLAIGGLYTRAIRDGVTGEPLLAFLAYLLAWLVPVVALAGGYMAIVGERRTGSIKLLLGQPFTRPEVLVGKILGRTSVIAVAVTIAYVAAGVLIFAIVGGFPVVTFLWLLFATILFGVVFVCIAVSISAIASTRARAMSLAFGLLVLFQVLWSAVTMFVHVIVTLGSFPPARAPAWYLFLHMLNPSTAFVRVASLIFDGAVMMPATTISIDGVPVIRLLYDPRVSYEAPFYLSEQAMVFVLIAWVFGTGWIAYRRFDRADLG